MDTARWSTRPRFAPAAFEVLESRCLLSTSPVPFAAPLALLPRQVEYLDRGMNAIYQGSNKVYINWRLLGTDAADTTFNLYRISGTGSAIKLNATPIANTTDYVNTSVNVTVANTYYVKPVANSAEGAASESFTLPANPVAQQYRSVPLQIPLGGTTPDGVSYTYSANDTSAADLDGDGQYELIVKWDPSNSKDNSQSGYTGNVFIDAYQLDGTLLWRIDMGRNIRAGAHYTQFMVYDFDGDGKAEMGVKTAPGTIDGLGNPVLLGSDKVTDDYRNTSGYILSGPEYLTIFNGLDGRQMATTYYQVPRGTVSNWGDSYGNRVDRFLAGVGYFDGQRPSLLMCRGYYTRTVLTAWDYRNGQLTQRWIFDTGNSTTGALAGYRGQGAHSLTIGDVDGDGKDEITYGAMAINDDGTPLYTTGLGHGDALHMSDMDPSHPGLEVYQVHETESAHQGKGGDLRDAATGALLAYVPGTGDVGRGCAFDIDPRYPGFEMWNSSDGGIYNVDGTRIQDKPSNMFQNFGIWWDADPLRELLDGTTIGDWRIDAAGNGYRTNLIYAPAGLSSNNSTKSTPCLTADLYGDWREEVVWRKTDSTELQIWSTTIAASMRLPTLMHDLQYREAVAWQNVGYNQPPHTSYFLGQDMTMPGQPNVYTVRGGVLPTSPAITVNNPIGGTGVDLNVTAGDDPLGKLKYAWSVVGSSPAPVAFTTNGRNGVNNTTALFIRAGTYTLRATISDGVNTVQTDLTLTVNPTLSSLQVSGSNANLQSGQTRQFSVAAYDQFGEEMTPASVTWSLGAGSPGSVSASGLYSASAVGAVTVVATSGSISDSISFAVGSSAPTLATAATPSASTVTGTSVNLSVLGADDGGESNLTYSWSLASGPGSVQFSSNRVNASKNTVVTFQQPGAYTFKVVLTDLTNLSATSSAAVTVQQLASSVVVSPATFSMGTSLTRQFVATVKDQFGATLVGQSISWSTLSGGGSISSTGLFTAPAIAGKSTIQAAIGAKFGTATITSFGWSPYSLTAKKSASNIISLAFRDSTTIESGFQVQVARRQTNGTVQWLNFYPLGASSGSGGMVSYTFASAFATGTWAFRVRATSASGYSNWSNTAMVTI